jgi:hypothetical protein
MTLIESVLDVRCPQCGVAPGQPCESWFFASNEAVHNRRRDYYDRLLARAWREESQKADGDHEGG